MLILTEKVAQNLTNLFEEAGKNTEFGPDDILTYYKNKQVFIRIGIIEENDKERYTFSFTKTVGESDLVVEQHGWKIIYDKQFADKIDKVILDIHDDGNNVGLVFNMQ